MKTEPTVRAIAPISVGIASMLGILKPHLEPERLVAQVVPTLSRAYFPCVPGARDGDTAWQDWHRRKSVLATLEKARERFPAAYPIGTLIDDVRAALETRPCRKTSKAALALLLDSRVRLPLNPELYAEAASFDVVELGFPPAVIAAACQRLRREATFTPEIAEVIGMCRVVQSDYREALRKATEAFEAIERTHALIHSMAEGMSDEAPEAGRPQINSEALKHYGLKETAP